MSDSFATPWTVAHQAPLSMGFPRQEYWSGLPFPSPGDPPDPEMEPHLLHAGGFFITEPSGSGSTFCSFKIPTSHRKLERPSKWRRPCRTSLTLSTLQGKGRQWGFNKQGAGQGPYPTRLIHHKCVQQLQPRQTGDDVLLYKVSPSCDFLVFLSASIQLLNP